MRACEYAPRRAQARARIRGGVHMHVCVLVHVSLHVRLPVPACLRVRRACVRETRHSLAVCGRRPRARRSSTSRLPHRLSHPSGSAIRCSHPPALLRSHRCCHHRLVLHAACHLLCVAQCTHAAPIHRLTVSNAIQFASKAGVKLGKTKNSHAEKIEEASCPIPLWSRNPCACVGLRSQSVAVHSCSRRIESALLTGDGAVRLEE